MERDERLRSRGQLVGLLKQKEVAPDGHCNSELCAKPTAPPSGTNYAHLASFDGVLVLVPDSAYVHSTNNGLHPEAFDFHHSTPIHTEVRYEK